MQKSLSASLLCDAAGRMTAGDYQFVRLLGARDPAEMNGLTLDEVSQRLNCPELLTWFAEFMLGGDPLREIPLSLNGEWRQARLRRLKTATDQPLFLIEFVGESDPLVMGFPSSANRIALTEIGRLTGRLLHDFKNHISGLKLYAAYLKKHCVAASARGIVEAGEAAEITDKIIGGLNLMAEQAALISRLTQPLYLKSAPTSLVSLVSQLMDELTPLAVARGVELSADLQSESLSVNCDAQLLFTALRALTVRAISVCDAAHQVRLTLRREQQEIEIGIADGSSQALSETERATFFDLPVNERLSTNALGLALARRIIEQHGGRAEVTTATDSGALVTIRLMAK
jgi:signal transduction histidine kinase